jgi:excisionase family DNA binding protein
MKIQKYFSLREAANMLNISVDNVRTRLEQRQLAFTRIGGPRGRIRIAESDLEAFLARNRTAAHGEAIGSSKNAT